MLFGLFAVAIIWGVTNPFIRKGAILIERQKLYNKDYQNSSGLKRILLDLSYLCRSRNYLIPFLLNLSGSVLFYSALKLSLVGPITNSLTIVISSITGVLLGEPRFSLGQVFGILFILVGVAICTSSWS